MQRNHKQLPLPIEEKEIDPRVRAEVGKLMADLARHMRQNLGPKPRRSRPVYKRLSDDELRAIYKPKEPLA